MCKRGSLNQLREEKVLQRLQSGGVVIGTWNLKVENSFFVCFLRRKDLEEGQPLWEGSIKTLGNSWQ